MIDRWLIRMSQWARNPPSMRRVMLWATIIAICLAVFGLERFGLWPEWMTVSKTPRIGF